MNFRTEIKNIDLPLKINHRHKLFLIGSCFSDNIAGKLAERKFDTLSNPFGILYNPISINKTIERIIDYDLPETSSFVQNDDIWHHFDYHGDMSGVYLEEVSRRIKIITEASLKFLRSVDYLFLTFGTSNIHRRRDNNQIVANNHKFPSAFFTRDKLSIDEIVDSTSGMLQKLKQLSPKLKTIITLSPVRHIKDGIIENQRSKATLLLAIERLVNNKDVFYFPAYELLLDDLRDYRFYAKDLVHPSESAIEYIWEKFSNTFFNEYTLQLIDEIEKINKSLKHKPFNENTEKHKDFKKKLEQKIRIFKERNPGINF